MKYLSKTVSIDKRSNRISLRDGIRDNDGEYNNVLKVFGFGAVSRKVR